MKGDGKIRFKDLYDAYVKGLSSSDAAVSYRAFTTLVKEVFPWLTVKKEHEHSKAILYFCGIKSNDDKENELVTEQIKTECDKAGFCTLKLKDATSMCKILPDMCNGQRILKEVLLKGRTVTVKVAGRVASSPEILQEVANSNELCYILQKVATADICHGILVTAENTEYFTNKCLPLEVWSACSGKYVRSSTCHGFLSRVNTSGMCIACSKKRDNVNGLKRCLDHDDHNYSSEKLKVRKVELTKDDNDDDGKSKCNTSTASEDESVDEDTCISDDTDDTDKDPTYDPFKLNATPKDHTTHNYEELSALLETMAPTLSDSFVELIKAQIQNANAKDKRLCR
jgi:hypothetical protein